MAVPIATFLSMGGWGAAAGRVGMWAGAAALATTVSGYAGAVVAPGVRGQQYSSNKGNPNLIPDIGDLIQAYYSGTLHANNLQQLLWEQGANWSLNFGASIGANMWKRVIEAKRPIPDLPSSYKAFHRGIIDANVYNDIVSRHGINLPEHDIVIKRPAEPLPLSLIINLFARSLITSEEAHAQLRAMGYSELADRQWLLSPAATVPIELVRVGLARGYIDEGQAEKLLRAVGYSDRTDRNLILNPPLPPTLPEILAIRNRGWINDEIADGMLKASGYGDITDRQNLLKLRNQIPSPQELLHMQIRDVWNQDTVDRFQLDAEHYPEFDHFMGQQGFAWDARTPDQQAAGAPPVSWTKLFQRAAVVLVSPQQAYQMYQRLRANRLHLYQGLIPDLREFTLDDVKRILRDQDYAPPLRDALTAIAFNVLTRVDIRRMFELGIITKEEAEEQYRDQGYNPTDSKRLADFGEQIRQQQRTGRLRGQIRGQVISAYRVGGISRSDAEVQLHKVFLTGVAAIQEFEGQLPEAQQFLANQNPVVRTTLDQVDFEAKLALAKNAITAIRKGFLQMDLTVDQARQALAQVGIQPVRINEYISGWQYIFLGRGKRLTARKIQEHVREKRLDPATALVRLGQLGYSLLEANLMLQEAVEDLALATAKAQERIAKTAQAAERARLQQLRQLRAESDRVRTALTRSAPRAKLEKWLGRRIIDESLFRRRLAGIGVASPDIDRAVQEVLASGGPQDGQSSEPPP